LSGVASGTRKGELDDNTKVSQELVSAGELRETGGSFRTERDKKNTPMRVDLSSWRVVCLLEKK